MWILKDGMENDMSKTTEKKYYSGNAKEFCEYPKFLGGPPLVARF